jgi:hypothetical protein
MEDVLIRDPAASTLQFADWGAVSCMSAVSFAGIGQGRFGYSYRRLSRPNGLPRPRPTTAAQQRVSLGTGEDRIGYAMK